MTSQDILKWLTQKKVIPNTFLIDILICQIWQTFAESLIKSLVGLIL